MYLSWFACGRDYHTGSFIRRNTDHNLSFYAETIGQVNEKTIQKYIKEQEECNRIEG